MLRLSRRLSKTDSSAGNRSIGGSLALYWLCMVLAMLAAALLLLSVTGVLSRTARQFGETAALQQSNTAALFTAQMDALAAQSFPKRSAESWRAFLPTAVSPLTR